MVHVHVHNGHVHLVVHVHVPLVTVVCMGIHVVSRHKPSSTSFISVLVRQW